MLLFECFTLQETKDLETAVASIRAEKVKVEAAEKAAKLKGATRFLNQ